MRPFCRGGQPDVDQLAHVRLPARNREFPPEEAMRQFRIVHLRSLYEADDYADARPRPALTIFVRLLPRLLDPVRGPIQKCKHGCSRGLLGETLGLGGSECSSLPCRAATKTVVHLRQCDAARLQE